MNIPQIVLPEYPITIPSTGEQLFFTPFLVKHQRAMLTAQETDDRKALIQTMNTVIKQCFKNKIQPEKLAVFDMIYIFSQLKAMSSGEVVDVILRCNKCVSDENAKVVVKFDLTQLKVEKFENHTNKIQLTDDGIGIIMKYPTLKDLFLTPDDNENTKDVIPYNEIVDKCIDKFYTPNGEIVDADSLSKTEINEFVENLTIRQMEKIEEQFLSTMPRIRKKFEFDCPVCETHCINILEGLDNFFI